MEAIRAEADRLVKKNPDVKIIIVLSHCGLDKDYRIAREGGKHIDVVIGGHTHSFMYTKQGDKPIPGVDEPVDDYPAVVNQEENGNRTVLIAHTSCFARWIGDLTVDFDKDGEIVSYEGLPMYLDRSIEPGTYFYRVK